MFMPFTTGLNLFSSFSNIARSRTFTTGLNFYSYSIASPNQSWCRYSSWDLLWIFYDWNFVTCYYSM